MRITTHAKAFLVAVAACAAATAIAAEPGAAASSAYRLTIDNPDAFRFSAREPYVPAPEPRKEPPSPVRLADKPFTELIQSAAHETALDPALVHALIYVESRYNPAARSPKGAIGLMQVLPGTASRYGVPDPARSLEANLRAGTRYLSDLMQLFDKRLDLVLAAYNAGEKAVLRYGQRIPPYHETQEYVPAVLAKYRELREPAQPAAVPGPVEIQYMPGTRLDRNSLRGADER